MSESFGPLSAFVLISPGASVKAALARAGSETSGVVASVIENPDSKALLNPSAADDRVVLWDLGANGIASDQRSRIARLARSYPLVLTSEKVNHDLKQEAANLGALDVLTPGDLSPAVLRILLRHIPARRSAERKLQRLALVDQDTGLTSQILFWEMLNQAVLTSRRAKDFFSVLLMDFNWPGVSPEAREEAVPFLFATAARRIRQLMRGTDTVARMDKSQITVLAVSMPRVEDVQVVAERLVTDLAEPIEFNGQAYRGGFAIGIALFPTSATDPESLVSRASHALASAREHGGNSYAFA